MGRQTPYFKMDHNLCQRSDELYYDKSITIDRTVHKNRPDIFTPDKTIKDVYAEVPNSRNLYSTFIDKPQKHTDLKEELTRIWQPSAVCTVQSVLSQKSTRKFETAQSSP